MLRIRHSDEQGIFIFISLIAVYFYQNGCGLDRRDIFVFGIFVMAWIPSNNALFDVFLGCLVYVLNAESFPL